MKKQILDEDLDDALEMTFPASDAVVPTRPHDEAVVARMDRQPVRLDVGTVSKLSKDVRGKIGR